MDEIRDLEAHVVVLQNQYGRATATLMTQMEASKVDTLWAFDTAVNNM